MTARSLSALRDAYDQQVRRNTAADGSGGFAQSGPDFVRWVANEGLGWSEISWSDLDASRVDECIETHIRYYQERGQSFVWRVYDYDQPGDLGVRLLAAGFSHAENSAVLVAESESLVESPPLAEGVEIVPVTDQSGIEELISTHEAVFGHDHDDLRRSLSARFLRAPRETEMYVAMASGLAISAARVEFLPDREFAALWGGGTLPEWRGRGIYRALVSIRAQSARARGYRYVFVLASDQSQPILDRLGFRSIASVSTYRWAPS